MKKIYYLLLVILLANCTAKDANPDYATELAGTYDGISISSGTDQYYLPSAELQTRAKIIRTGVNTGKIDLTFTILGSRTEESIPFEKITLENGKYYLARDGNDVIFVEGDKLEISGIDEGTLIKYVFRKL